MNVATHMPRRKPDSIYKVPKLIMMTNGVSNPTWCIKEIPARTPNANSIALLRLFFLVFVAVACNEETISKTIAPKTLYEEIENMHYYCERE